MAKILIIEDDTNLIELYEMKFKLEGYDVITAPDGEQGTGKAVTEQPDVILLDVLMPNVNGFEVLKELKNHKETENIPVLVYTNLGSSDSDEKRELAFSMGAADYLVKALHEPEAIVERVNQLIRGQKSTEGETENSSEDAERTAA